MTTQSPSPLAIHGGSPVRGPEKTWPSWPVFDDTERQALTKVFETGKWWYGEEVARFEREYAAFQDAKHCITCTSGTTAGEICMQAIGIKPGDEVIVPPYTFYATASMVARMGGTPVFVDIDDSWCMNPDLIEAAITPNTRAIMPVHFGGRVADMDRLNAIAEKHGILLIEDACHSWGSKWKGKGTGAIGKGGIFSFQASKNINAAEGGAILTDDDDFAKLCRSITNCGRSLEGAWYEHPNLGTNARMTEFQGAILCGQLSRLGTQTELREKNAALLNEELPTIDGLTVQTNDERCTQRSYHLYCIRMDPAVFGCSREALMEAAAAEGLTVDEGYPLPLYKQPAIAALPGVGDYSDRCPVTEDVCATSGLWIGHTTLLGTQQDMADIIAIFRKLKENAASLA